MYAQSLSFRVCLTFDRVVCKVERVLIKLCYLVPEDAHDAKCLYSAALASLMSESVGCEFIWKWLTNRLANELNVTSSLSAPPKQSQFGRSGDEPFQRPLKKRLQAASPALTHTRYKLKGIESQLTLSGRQPNDKDQKAKIAHQIVMHKGKSLCTE